MVDIRPEVYAILKTIATTYPEYPDILTQCAEANNPVPQEYFPMISYFDSGHDSDSYFNGKATTDDIEVTIDCWERQDFNTGEFKEIYFDVDSSMRNNGFRRTMYLKQDEDDTRIVHHSMKYKKLKEETP